MYRLCQVRCSLFKIPGLLCVYQRVYVFQGRIYQDQERILAQNAVRFRTIGLRAMSPTSRLLILTSYAACPSNTVAASRILAMISTSNGQRSIHTPHSTHADALTGNSAYYSLTCLIPRAGT